MGSWRDKKGAHEIDLIGINGLYQKVAFAEAKRNKDKASLPLLQTKAAAFLDQNRALTSYEAQYKVLSRNPLRTKKKNPTKSVGYIAFSFSSPRKGLLHLKMILI